MTNKEKILSAAPDIEKFVKAEYSKMITSFIAARKKDSTLLEFSYRLEPPFEKKDSEQATQKFVKMCEDDGMSAFERLYYNEESELERYIDVHVHPKQEMTPNRKKEEVVGFVILLWIFTSILIIGWLWYR